MKAPARKPRPRIDVSRSLVQTVAVSDRLTQFVVRSLPEPAWQAAPPDGKGRTIAAMVAHIHNVRRMWLVVAAKGLGIAIPDKLDRHALRRVDALKALKASQEAVTRLVEHAVAADGRVSGFRPDVVHFVAYLVTHDAHHRGQICTLARQLGHPLPKPAAFGMWEWGKQWRQCGFKEATVDEAPDVPTDKPAAPLLIRGGPATAATPPAAQEASPSAAPPTSPPAAAPGAAKSDAKSSPPAKARR